MMFDAPQPWEMHVPPGWAFGPGVGPSAAWDAVRPKGATRTHPWGETRSPLHVMCARGNLRVIKDLVDAGHNRWARSRAMNRTPLHEACFEGHLPVVRWLLEDPKPGEPGPPAGFLVSTDDTGFTPLLAAVSLRDSR